MNAFDPVELDICWHRLVGVVNEQAAALTIREPIEAAQRPSRTVMPVRNT